MNNAVTVRRDAYLGESYYYIDHSSGLRIYVLPKKLSTSYAIFGTRYGSIDNRFRIDGAPDYTVVPDGIAHYLEHKMFENEDGVDTFARYAKTGASANAYTSFRSTCYLFSCTDNFSDSLEILLDFVTHPYFTAQTVQKEQGIIGQEIRMGEDNPDRALIFGLLGAMYEKNNVRIEIAGTVESISHITADLLYSCYNTFYNLHNMALAVCGDVTPETVIAAADKVLKPQKPIRIESVQEAEQPQVFKPRFSRAMQVSKPIFDIGIKNPDISDDPRERLRYSYALGIIYDLLFGPSTEFYNKLYEDKLINTSLDCWSESNKDYSFMTLSGESDDPEKLYERFLSHVAETRKAGRLDSADFERNRLRRLASYVKSFDNTEEIANNLIDCVFDDCDIFDDGEVLRALDPKYCYEVFDRLFHESQYSLATVVPLEK